MTPFDSDTLPPMCSLNVWTKGASVCHIILYDGASILCSNTLNIIINKIRFDTLKRRRDSNVYMQMEGELETTVMMTCHIKLDCFLLGPPTTTHDSLPIDVYKAETVAVGTTGLAGGRQEALIGGAKGSFYHTEEKKTTCFFFRCTECVDV